MKTNFKFYFYLIFYTAFLSAVLYGVAQRLVEHYINFFSFGLLVITVVGIAGMMRSIASIPAENSGQY